ncbi:MAG: hypothetical protein ACOYL3_22325 [Desulfuromonadaceae bacterium]
MPVRTLNIQEATYCCPPFHPEINTGILTRDSALLLLQLYPLFLWSGKNYCVLGRRILHIISPHVYGKDKIRVVYLPSASENEVKILMTVEPLLNQIAFATPSGSKGILETSRKIGNCNVSAVSPLLNQPMDTIAKLFSDSSVSTLSKLSAKLECKA